MPPAMFASSRKWWIRLFIVLLIGAALGTGWLALQARRAVYLSEPEHARRAGQPIPVRTALVESSEIVKMVGGTSLTVARKAAPIRTTASRVIPAISAGGGGISPNGLVVKRLLVTSGEYVHSGQLLAELDDSDYVAAAKGWENFKAAADKAVEYRQKVLDLNKQIRELAITQAAAEVKYRNVDLDTRGKIRTALETLSKTGAASRIHYFESISQFAEGEYQLVYAQLDLLRAKVNEEVGLLQDQYEVSQAVANRDQAAAALEMARRNIAACRLVSPLDGYLGRVDIVPGQVVDTTLPALMEVFMLDPIWVCMDYPQERIGELELGLDAEVIVDSFPQETFKGKVVAMMPNVRADTRVLPVYIEVKNPGSRIRAGVTGFCRVIVAQHVTMVPAAAVMQSEHRATVFRIEGGRARLREVETGFPTEQGKLEITKGLSAGDEVVVFGNIGLQDNDAVDMNWRKWARRD